MKLLFERNTDELLCLGEFSNEKLAMEATFNFLDQKNYKSHYTHFWKTTIKYKEKEYDAIKIDIGSHTEFFYILVRNIENLGG